MKAVRRGITLLYCLYFHSPSASAQGTANLKLHTDFIYLSNDKKLLQEIFYATDSSFKAELSMECFKIENSKDSLLLYSKKQVPVLLRKGANRVTVHYTEKDSNTYCLPVFRTILQKANSVPPGSYRTYISVRSGSYSNTAVISTIVDSNLKLNSAVRRQINSTLLPKRSLLGINAESKINNIPAAKALTNAHKKIERVAKKSGLTPVQIHANGTDYIDFYYQSWFIGRYKAEKNESISRQIAAQEGDLNGNPGLLTNNDLENHPSLFFQFRELKKDKQADQKITGELSLMGNFSDGQEPNSDLDNNFTELRGRIEIPVADMPVQVEGMYTTQDAHRQAKASYIHFHYDVDKAKENLSRLIDGYKERYGQTVSKGIGMEMVYQSYVNQLEGRQAGAAAELQKEINFPVNGTPVNLDSLKSAAMQNAISNNTGADKQKLKDSVNNVYKHASEKYQRLLALEGTIAKYKNLLLQNRNTNYFDSALAYGKVKDIGGTEQMTYKQLAKKAGNILPEGKSKSFLNGITRFDAGMFSQYESKYTMSGQMLKGLSFGYDLGFCQTGFTLGKTEYIGADGTVDKYTSYSANVSISPYKQQRLNLIYYGYMPSKQMLSESFFKDADIAAPSFRDPVHIISADYLGTITKYVQVNAEAATSLNNTPTGNTIKVSAADRMAYNIQAEGNVPNSAISLSANYSKAGIAFQNNSLPVSPAGTEQYQLSAKGDFFRAFVTIGLDYNYLLQSNYASEGGNKRWGFSVQTHSRKYPSIGLSYKPFSTFRSYTDTLSIPQRPLIGSVWTGKGSYQWKKHGRSLRFILLYSKNVSSMDTVKYGSSLMQFTTMYTVKLLTASIMAGSMQMSGTNENIGGIITTPNKMQFVNLTANYLLGQQVSLSGEQDFGVADFGFCRYSAACGIAYTFLHAPFIVRTNIRYSDYELSPGEGWKQLYSGNIELTWQFKYKMREVNL